MFRHKGQEMKKRLLNALCLALILFVSGCASSRYGDPCNSRPTLRSWWQNNCVRNYFRGEPCNSCNPPAGQPSSFDTNLIPGCEDGSCGGMVAPGPQTTIQGTSPSVPYYDDQFNNGLNNIPTSMNQTSGYMPAGSSNAIGSGVELNAPLIGANNEIEQPPMYGQGSSFN